MLDMRRKGLQEKQNSQTGTLLGRLAPVRLSLRKVETINARLVTSHESKFTGILNTANEMHHNPIGDETKNGICKVTDLATRIGHAGEGSS